MTSPPFSSGYSLPSIPTCFVLLYSLTSFPARNPTEPALWVAGSIVVAKSTGHIITFCLSPLQHPTRWKAAPSLPRSWAPRSLLPSEPIVPQRDSSGLPCLIRLDDLAGSLSCYPLHFDNGQLSASGPDLPDLTAFQIFLEDSWIST